MKKTRKFCQFFAYQKEAAKQKIYSKKMSKRKGSQKSWDMGRNAEKNTEKREVVSGKNTRQKSLNQEICGTQRKDRRKVGEGGKESA